jgi:hypothetical protein
MEIELRGMPVDDPDAGQLAGAMSAEVAARRDPRQRQKPALKGSAANPGEVVRAGAWPPDIDFVRLTSIYGVNRSKSSRGGEPLHRGPTAAIQRDGWFQG